MSHHSVLVLLDPKTSLRSDAIVGAVAAALEPYDESEITEPRDDGPVADDQMQEVIDYYAGQAKDGILTGVPADGTLRERFDALYPMVATAWNHGMYLRSAAGEWRQMVVHNPVGFWDWWVIGGRWDGTLIAEQEGDVLIAAADDSGGPLRANAVQLRFIDWTAMSAGRLKLAAAAMDGFERGEYSIAVNEAGLRTLLGFPVGMTRAEWIEGAVRNDTFAVIDPQGVWHAQGTMGSFGHSRDNDPNWAQRFKALIDGADPDCIAVMVDCHT